MILSDDDNSCKIDFDAVLYEITNAPTISPDSLRPKGRWEAYPSDAYMRCSVCKREYLKAKMPDEVGYCPNPHCGADMREDG